MRIALVVACVLVLTRPVPAGAVEPGDPVAGHAGLTYFDFLKLVVTDLEPTSTPDNSTAHQIVPYRHIEGKTFQTDPAGPVAIKSLEVLQMHADGKPRLALLADLGGSQDNVEEFVLLALFDLADRPRLLDVVEVGNDQMTGFIDRPLSPLGHGSDLIRIDSDHFNSDEDFVDTELVFVRNGRFRLLDSIFTLDVKACTYQRLFQPSVATRPDAARPYRQIVFAVRETLTLQPDRALCGQRIPRPFVRTFRTTYRWNTRRRTYVTTSSDFGSLGRVIDRISSGTGQP